MRSGGTLTRRRGRFVVLVVLVAGAVAPALPAIAAGPAFEGSDAEADSAATDESKPKTQPRIQPLPDGSMQAVFVDRSPLSDFEVLAERFAWSAKMDRPADYVLEHESFVIYMPPAYNPTQPDHGLFIWISPTDSGAIPAVWQPVMDEHKLVWIGANGSGNERPGQWHRLALALDALYNMTSHFAIDEERVYVSGFSGGGKAASLLAPTFSDVIDGGLYICGCHYFRKISVVGRPGNFYEPQMKKPAPEFYDRACTHSRFVLLTGEEDFNQNETESIYRHGYQRDPFKHVTYIEVPKMPHAMPMPEYLEQAIEALDEGVGEDAES